MRQIILDTETTGIDPKDGHRLIEIGAVEMRNRRLTGNTYHQYINPERDIEREAIEIHGITNERVANEPVFAKIADEFWAFIQGAELVIHNAPFDVGFIDHEFKRLNADRDGPHLGPVAEHCQILDTLRLARKKHPGQRNNLDALCKRYAVDNTQRVLHGALLDAEILADVYLTMTGGQTALTLSTEVDRDNSTDSASHGSTGGIRRVPEGRFRLNVIQPSLEELDAHRETLARIHKTSGECLWEQQLGKGWGDEREGGGRHVSS